MSAIDDRPCLLVTNDDGIDAPGLQTLVAAVWDLGRVVAPDRGGNLAAWELTLP